AKEESTTCPAASPEQIISNFEEPPLPACAFVGAWYSEMSEVTAQSTGYYRFPQVSGSSVSDRLDNTDLFPYFARTIPAQRGAAEAFVDFLISDPSFLEIPYLAILHIDDAYSNGYVTRVREAVDDFNSIESPPHNKVYVENVPLRISGNDVTQQISKLKDLRFSTIFAVLPFIASGFHDDIMMEAFHQGIVGKNTSYVWYFSEDSAATILQTERAKNASNSTEVMEYMKSVVPRTPGINETRLLGGIDHPSFLDPAVVDTRIQFIYEATVLLGLAACNASHDNLTLDGDVFFENVLSNTFQGVSGTVAIDPRTGSRIGTKWNLGKSSKPDIPVQQWVANQASNR
ncbi:MAG: hypothetical protein SGILL_007470, partial [Bacillariaceae sp.]